MFLVIIDVTLQNQKQELQHTLRPFKSSSLVLILTTQSSTRISIYEFVTILKCFSYKLQKVPNLIFVIFGVGLIRVNYLQTTI